MLSYTIENLEVLAVLNSALKEGWTAIVIDAISR